MMPSTNPTVKSDPASLTDLELVAKIASGDGDALDVLWARHHALVFQWCCRKLGDHLAADAVVQETMYAFWKYVDSARPIARPGGLIMTIARRRCVDAIRRKGRDNEFRDADIGSDSNRFVIPELADPHQALDRLHARVQIVLDSLDEKDQIIGYYYFLLDPRPSLKEIGAMVQLDAGNVHRRLNGIRERLKVELDDFG
jgi:RNA polymerase sigma factor (sigma-70 family)